MAMEGIRRLSSETVCEEPQKIEAITSVMTDAESIVCGYSDLIDASFINDLTWITDPFKITAAHGCNF